MASWLRRLVNGVDRERCVCHEVRARSERCPCRGETLRSLFELRRARGEACPRCASGRRAVTWWGLCADCALAVGRLAQRRVDDGAEEAPQVACAWCGLDCPRAVGRDGRWLCDSCLACAHETRAGRGLLYEEPPQNVVCSFCGLQAPWAVAGPGVFLCSRCVEAACKLRRRGRRAPVATLDLHCSFDGKPLRELGALYVSDRGASFCDECFALVEELDGVWRQARAIGLRSADPDAQCVWCRGPSAGGYRAGVGAGPAICAGCVEQPPRVVAACTRCGRSPGARVEVGAWDAWWCLDCALGEARQARVVAARGDG